MLYIDLKYISLISPKLLRFKQVDTHAFRFRCPFCGDSQKSKIKTRGNVFPYKNGLSYKCFNCHQPYSFGELIRHVDPFLFKEYILEKYRGDSPSAEEPIFKKEKVELLTDAILDNLIRISDLSTDHPAVKYIEDRKIPKDKWDRLYYTRKFKTWVNSILPNKFDISRNDNPRLVFPYMNKHGKVFAANSRAFGDEEPKYIITKFDSNCETIYGLDTVSWGRHIYVTEGQIDSLFLPNALAVSGSSFDLDTIRKVKTNCTLIVDNEPRNKQITKLIYSYIEKGYNICLFPETFGFKDVNDAVIGGMEIEEIMKIIDRNTFRGLTAKLKFSEWRKTTDE